jgi:hypothetical protein
MSEERLGSVPSRTADLLGDPEGLAEYQFQLALERCAHCRDYHAVWPYRRLALTVAGIESTADVVGKSLRDVVQRDGRILIAGAADAGMLALTADATRKLHPQIDVADRCPTPLAACRRYAEAQGLPIGTYQLDLADRLPPHRYDAVFADCVLQFVPREAHVDFLTRLREAMNRRSVLILVERLRTPKPDSPARRDRAGEIVAALAKNGVPLTEDEATFVQRLNGMLSARQTRFADFSAADELPSRVVQAGFRLKPLSDDERQRTVFLANGDRVVMTLVVASPAGD